MIQSRLIAYGLILAILVGACFYVMHLKREAARVPALVSTINELNKQRENERESAQRALEQEAAIRRQIDVVERKSADTTRRLFDTIKALSSAAPGSTDSAGADDNGSRIQELREAVGRASAACRKGSAQADGWQGWFTEVPAELK